MNTKERKTRKPFSAIGWEYAALVSLSLLIGLVGCEYWPLLSKNLEEKSNKAGNDIEVSMYPGSGAEIWGHQIFTIEYDASRNLEIKEIQAITDHGAEPLIRDDNPLYAKPGLYEIVFCAECTESQNVTIEVIFEEGHGPLVQEYQINHMPRVAVTSEEIGEEIIIDASGSFDPEGNELTFEWVREGIHYQGPVFQSRIASLVQSPAMLGVSDGSTVLYDLVGFDYETRRVFCTADSLRCKNMAIVGTGNSLLNPGKALGASPAVGTQLPINSNKHTTRPYTIHFGFEVRASVVRDTFVLDEGQDIAISASFKANDSTQTMVPEGKKRSEPNRSIFEDGTVLAPFPDNLIPGKHPTMIADDYDHHPTLAQVRKNTPTGVGLFNVKKKDCFNNKMIWFDKPGMTVPRGTDVSNGMFFKAYFRAWMKPDLKLCQKYFTVIIEIDTNGVVTKNELQMR